MLTKFFLGFLIFQPVPIWNILCIEHQNNIKTFFEKSSFQDKIPKDSKISSRISNKLQEIYFTFVCLFETMTDSLLPPNLA